MQTDILIVGAGLGGLSLATALTRSGAACRLVEARARVGGRMLSLANDYAGTGVTCADLGPSWIWPGQPRIARLLQQLDIPVFEQYSLGRLVYEDELGQLRRDLDYSTMAGSLRVQGGMGRVSTELAAQLLAEIIHQSHRVTRIQQLEQGFEIEIDQAGDLQHWRARKVVLALPPRVIAETIEFDPPLPTSTLRDLATIPTWMAGHAKFFAIYAAPFWREMGLSGDAISRRGPLMEIHDASAAAPGFGALFGFVGLPAGSAQRETDELTRSAVAQLQKMFGDGAAKPVDTLLKDWARDPFTATAADHHPTPHPQYGRPASIVALAEQGLVLASTEMAPGFGGFVEGALEAAEDALQYL